MSSPTENELLARVPAWILQPLTPRSTRREDLIERVLAGDPDSGRIVELSRGFTHYIPLVNIYNARRWEQDDRDTPNDAHWTWPAQLRILRRLSKHPNRRQRTRAWLMMRRRPLFQVALPNIKDGPWDETGWWHGLRPHAKRKTQQSGHFFQGPNTVVDPIAEHGLPSIETIAQLRDCLGLKSSKQLGWLLLATDARSDEREVPYRTFTIPKRSGAPRVICAPCPSLRYVQRRILDQILLKVPVHDCAHGFVPGRSIVTNAAPHVGQALLIKFDLQNFFPSIFYNRVVGLFAGLGYAAHDARFSAQDESRRVAATLARLCVYTECEGEWMDGFCPQGAPTSPAISNLLCRRLDRRCQGLAKRFSGVYTRYADDLTFSFPKEDFDLGRFRWWIDQVCHQEGFFVNQSKYRVIRRSRRQSVTGIVVNDTLRVPREARRRFRAILHDAQTNGLDAAARGRPGIGNWLHGFAAYLYMVHPAEGRPALDAVRALLGRTPVSEQGGTGAFKPGPKDAKTEKVPSEKSLEVVQPVVGTNETISVAPSYWLTDRGAHEMAPIPAGMFLYGQSRMPLETDAFSMARYPVTNAQWFVFVQATGYQPPADHPRPETYLKHWCSAGSEPPAALLDHPVTWISFVDALAYARWVGGCIPTEVLWEKAARGLDGRPFPWGDAVYPIAEYARVNGRRYRSSHYEDPLRNLCEARLPDLADGPKQTTVPVQTYTHVRSAFGCEQMIGNVSEWCVPASPEIAGANAALPGLPPLEDLLDPVTLMPVRGSCFFRTKADIMTCHHRRRLSATRRNQWTGLRIAFTSR